MLFYLFILHKASYLSIFALGPFGAIRWDNRILPLPARGGVLGLCDQGSHWLYPGHYQGSTSALPCPQDKQHHHRGKDSGMKGYLRASRINIYSIVCVVLLFMKHSEKEMCQNVYTVYFSNSCPFSILCFSLLQLKGSDLELTLVKGSSAPQAPLNGPACTYVNVRVKVNNKEQGAHGKSRIKHNKCW